MARLKALPSIDIIRGFRGVLDFYVWRGLPCVRRWPDKAHATRTPAEIAAGRTFGAIIKAWSLVGSNVKALYTQEALDNPRTARDIYVSGALGHQHEATMSDFLNLLTQAVSLLNTIEDLTHALGSIDTDDLQVDVKSCPLPADAATATNQALHTVALALIGELQGALQTVATDRLLVRGQDQLHSFKQPLYYSKSDTISGANGFVVSAPVPEGQIWHVTWAYAVDVTSPTTAHSYHITHDDVGYYCLIDYAARAAAVPSNFPVQFWLDEGDLYRVYFPAGQVADTCIIRLLGEIMTKET